MIPIVSTKWNADNYTKPSPVCFVFRLDFKKNDMKKRQRNEKKKRIVYKNIWTHDMTHESRRRYNNNIII